MLCYVLTYCSYIYFPYLRIVVGGGVWPEYFLMMARWDHWDARIIGRVSSSSPDSSHGSVGQDSSGKKFTRMP